MMNVIDSFCVPYFSFYGGCVCQVVTPELCATIQYRVPSLVSDTPPQLGNHFKLDKKHFRCLLVNLEVVYKKHRSPSSYACSISSFSIWLWISSRRAAVISLIPVRSIRPIWLRNRSHLFAGSAFVKPSASMSADWT